MSSVKISGLPVSSNLNVNPSQSLFPTTDLGTGITTRIDAGSLGNSLYANNTLTVGSGGVVLPNIVAQFTGTNQQYVQVNLQNIGANGSADLVITGDTGTDSNTFLDLGFNNSNFIPDGNFSAMGPNDGYLYVQGTGNTTVPSGNLIVGTASPNTEIKFMAAGTNDINVVMKVKYNDVKFRQNTLVNIANTLLVNTITFYDNTSLNSFSVIANHTSNIANLQLTTANNTANIANLQSYSNAAFAKANTAVQNTAVIQLNALTLTGNLIANSSGQGIFVDTFTSNSATFTKNMVVLGNLSANTLLGNIFFSNVVTTTSQSNSIIWFPQASTPTQTVAQLWYYSNTQSLILDTDIAGDRLSISKVLFFRAYNSSGATIPANSFIRLVTGVTANQIPYISLADATSSANATVAGFVKNSIANGAYGFAYSQGIVEDLNSSGLGQNGDILFLSTTPGLSSNVAPSGANTVVQLGRIILSDATQGKLFIQNQLRQAYGRPNGQVLYAYANNIVGSNSININDSIGVVNANTIVANTFVYGSATANSGVTQTTSRTTSVTANGISGTIIGYAGSNFQHGTGYVFTVNNSSLLHNTDIVFVAVQSSNCPVPQVSVANTRVGSFDICVYNGSGAGNDAAYTMNINFGIIRVGS